MSCMLNSHGREFCNVHSLHKATAFNYARDLEIWASEWRQQQILCAYVRLLINIYVKFCKCVCTFYFNRFLNHESRFFEQKNLSIHFPKHWRCIHVYNFDISYGNETTFLILCEHKLQRHSLDYAGHIVGYCYCSEVWDTRDANSIFIHIPWRGRATKLRCILRVVGFVGGRWIDLAPDRVLWRNSVFAALDLRSVSHLTYS
jgi:hypothetical protein